MPPDEQDLKYMWDMLRAGRQTLKVVEDWTYERFVDDLTRRLALERSLEIIGEAARNVSVEGRSAAPSLGWKAIVSTRHIIAHEYGVIDHSKLWRAATVHVPAMVLALSTVLENNPPGIESGKDLTEP